MSFKNCIWSTCVAINLLATPCVARAVTTPVSQIESDLAWCFGAAVAQNELHVRILEDADQAPENVRLLTTILSPASPTPDQIFLARKQLSVFSSTKKAELDAKRDEGRAHWAQAPRARAATARILFYDKKRDIYSKTRPDCTLRLLEAGAEVQRKMTTKLDGTVEVPSSFMNDMPSTISEVLGVEAARKIISLMLVSDNLDPNERDVLREIMLGKNVDITDGHQTLSLASADQEARDLISFFVTPTDMSELWMISPRLTGLFAQTSLVSSRMSDMLSNFVAQQLYEEAKTSKLSNLYAPLKSALADIQTMSERIENPKSAKQTRRLAFLAMRKIDAPGVMDFPDSFYLKFQK